MIEPKREFEKGLRETGCLKKLIDGSAKRAEVVATYGELRQRRPQQKIGAIIPFSHKEEFNNLGSNPFNF